MSESCQQHRQLCCHAQKWLWNSCCRLQECWWLQWERNRSSPPELPRCGEIDEEKDAVVIRAANFLSQRKCSGKNEEHFCCVSMHTSQQAYFGLFSPRKKFARFFAQYVTAQVCMWVHVCVWQCTCPILYLVSDNSICLTHVCVNGGILNHSWDL